MANRIKFIKNKSTRKNFHQSELQNYVLASIAKNPWFPNQLRYECQKKIQLLGKLRSIAPDYCLETGRGRGITPKFGLSRLTMRHWIRSGRIPGMQNK